MYRWILITVKPVLSGHSNIDETKVLKPCGSLMQVESIAECSPWSILKYFWTALSDNWSWKPIFGLFDSGCLRQVLLYCIKSVPHAFISYVSTSTNPLFKPGNSHAINVCSVFGVSTFSWSICHSNMFVYMAWCCNTNINENIQPSHLLAVKRWQNIVPYIYSKLNFCSNILKHI